MATRAIPGRWRDARAAAAQVDAGVLQRYGLLGVGAGLKRVSGRTTDEPCVKAYVLRKLPPASLPPGRLLPTRWPHVPPDGTALRTDVEAMSLPTSPPWHLAPDDAASMLAWVDSRRRRPMQGGDSISHFAAPLGTVACAVFDPYRASEPLLLSCNHVLAALNRGGFGDPIVQPARDDGGRAPRDVCGALLRFVPVRFGLSAGNIADAALAWVPASVWPIDGLGPLTGVRGAGTLRPGEAVYKSGRSTGVTIGQVEAVEFGGWIPYPAALGGGVALFRNQILTTPMAAFGDSGALLIDADRRGVGLLFGGSPTHTLFNELPRVLGALGVVARTGAGRLLVPEGALP